MRPSFLFFYFKLVCHDILHAEKKHFSEYLYSFSSEINDELFVETI